MQEIELLTFWKQANITFW